MKTRKLSFGAFFLALGLLLPQVFHFLGGPATGSLFLPMHIPVILAGLLLGYKYGVLVGILSPILSFFILSMPQIPMLYLMLIELIFYGLTSGLLYKKLKLNIFLSLLLTLIAGRISKSVLIFIALNVLNFKFPPALSTIPLLITGIPGIIIQIILIPTLVILFERKYRFE